MKSEGARRRNREMARGATGCCVSEGRARGALFPDVPFPIERLMAPESEGQRSTIFGFGRFRPNAKLAARHANGDPLPRRSTRPEFGVSILPSRIAATAMHRRGKSFVAETLERYVVVVQGRGSFSDDQ